MLRFLFVVLIFLSVLPKLSAQSQHFRGYGIDEGLSQSYIYTLLQDKEGYIWIGTGDGLSKFNSRKFTNFTTQNSLNEDFVTATCLDDKNKIWIGHFGGGLTYYDKETEQFQKFKLKDPTSSIENTSRINKLVKAKDNKIWCLTQNNGLFSIDENQEIHHFKKELEGLLLYDLLESLDGKLVVATNNGVRIVEIKNNEFSKVEKIKDLEDEYISCLAFSEANKGFWIASRESGLYFYSIENQQLSPISITNSNKNKFDIRTMLEDHKNNLWFGTSENGLFKVSYQKNKPQQLISVRQFSQNEGLQNPFVSALMQDREGNIWVGTYGDGLFQFRGELFSAYHIADFLPSPHVSSVIKDSKGNLWIGTELGILKIEKGTIFQNVPKTSLFLKNKDISSLFEDKTGVIWVGTKGEGGFRIKPESGKIEDLNKRSDFEAQIINKIAADKKGNIWIASRRFGALKYSIQEKSFTNYSLKEGFLSNNINDVFPDSKGRIWFASLGAPLSYFENGESVILKSKKINRVNFLCITEDKNGLIWLGTEGAGVFSYNGKEFKNMSTHDGLLSNYAYSVKADTKNNIWIGSRKGISKYSVSQKTVKNFDNQSGFSNLRIATHGVFEEQNGDLWFSTFEGILHYQTALEKKNTVEPAIYLSKVTVNLENANSKETLQLPYGQHIIQFEFEALSFSQAEKVKYKYKLEGHDSQWSPLSSTTFAYYPRVEDGEYTFLVKAANNDGLWTTTPSSFLISVEAPIWKKWWFYAIILAILGLSIFAYIRFKLYSLRKAKKQLEILVEQQTHEIRGEKENVEAKNEQLKTTLEKLQDTQSQLIQSEKMASLGQLTAGLAHEMNNPLNFVQAGAKALEVNIDDTLLLLEKYAQVETAGVEEKTKILAEIHALKNEIAFEEVPEDMRGILEDIHIGATRTTQIVASLRDFSRLDEASLKAVDIHEGLNATILLLSSQAKGLVKITKNYEEFLPEIECYVSQLNQVFLHIFTNAIQSIEAEGEIIISTRSTEETIEISFKDNGSGIEDDILGKIFDPFFTTKDVGAGKGLGLSTSYGIIQKHYGHIEVKSKKGEGSEFIISIPKRIDE